MTRERRRRRTGETSFAPCARPGAWQREPAARPHSRAASRTRPAGEPKPPPPRPPTSCDATAAMPRCGTRRTRSSGRHYSEDWSGIREKASLPRTYGISSSFRLFLVVPRGKRAWGVRERPLKKRPSILASLQVRVPVAPSTQRRKVRALIRSPILRSDDVVTDEALGLTTLRAAVAVSLLHPRCLLLPPALV